MDNRAAKALAREGLGSLVRADGDMGEMADAIPLVSEFLRTAAAPEFECAMVPLPPTPERVYRGPEGLAEGWKDWSEPFASIRGELERVVETESHLVVLIDQVAITRHGGVRIVQPSAMVWAFAEGRVVRLEMHLDRDKAFRSAGLEPQSSQP